MVIYTTEDRKSIKVYDLSEKKFVQEIQLKDPEAKDPNEALEVYQRVSNVLKIRFNKESEDILEAFLAVTNTEPRRLFVCPINQSSDEKRDPFEIKNYHNDKQEYLIEGSQIQIHLTE